ncbi:hypothetical protein DENSPDRAFT_341366 [Dentipellis sp. KUC8613]|nr:hypothetical protein DENSPDRAFT_341366 [Dentipellis sp. KUC8613]
MKSAKLGSVGCCPWPCPPPVPGFVGTNCGPKNCPKLGSRGPCGRGGGAGCGSCA